MLNMINAIKKIISGVHIRLEGIFLGWQISRLDNDFDPTNAELQK